MSTSTNYFVVPTARAPKSRMTTSTTDPKVGSVVTIGESVFRVVARYDVATRVKTWKTNESRTIIPIPTGTLYYRAKLESGPTGFDVVLRGEKNKDGDVVTFAWSIVEKDSEEWIAIKVAKILEDDANPNEVDWSRFFFFDDRDPASTLKAYDAARLVSSSVAVFRPIAIPGPWSTAKLVGDFSGGAN